MRVAAAEGWPLWREPEPAAHYYQFQVIRSRRRLIFRSLSEIAAAIGRLHLHDIRFCRG
jgi:hypothetical protein